MKTSCAKIFSASKFIDYFVHDILDYTLLNKESKNFTKNESTFDIRDAIEEIMDIQIDKVEFKNISVEKKFKGFDDDNYNLKADVKRLQQVFLNLISNAVKFTDRLGKIIIIIEKIDQFIRISITDNGIGIKENEKDKLFKLFGSIKDEKKKINTNGIGLGLVISKLIVERFNGYIDFISTHKIGSTFFYTFETEQAPKEIEISYAPKFRKTMALNNIGPFQTYSGSLKQQLQAFRKNRILVVDDEVFCLSSVKVIL